MPNEMVTWSVPVVGASASLSSSSSLSEDERDRFRIRHSQRNFRLLSNYRKKPARCRPPSILPTRSRLLWGVRIANNPTVDDLVEQYYAVVLQRPSDAAGKAFWMGEANRLCLLGIDPKQAFLVLGAGFNSPEYLDSTGTTINSSRMHTSRR